MGEILISLSYFPTAERLTIVVVEARNLQFSKNRIFGDSFVKISLLRKSGKIIESYRTSVRRNDPNPQLNEATIFKVSTKDFKRMLIKVTVYELQADNQEIPLGHVFIGPKSLNSQNSHWEYMLKQVRRQVN